MYGAILGDLTGFPYKYSRGDISVRETPLPFERADVQQAGPDAAGDVFSEKTVFTGALQDGLLRFEKKIPLLFASKGRAETQPGISSNDFEKEIALELENAMRRFGTAYPLAGYGMELSIWLFRNGRELSEREDPGPAARVSPVAWMFQEDLYMMRRIAVLQALLTNKNRESVKAADAAACAVFLAIHGCTKDYIASYLEKNFGYRIPDTEQMKKEIAQDGGSGSSIPALCVRAAVTAFLYGKDFEDVLRRAVSLCGARTDTAAVTAIAGSIAEAYFGIPDEYIVCFRRVAPEQVCRTTEAFAARMNDKKRARDQDPVLKANWENALARASEHHPAAVQGNELLEQAIDELIKNKDQQSLAAALQTLCVRAGQKGRVYVPVSEVTRPESEGLSAKEVDFPADKNPQMPSSRGKSADTVRPGNAGLSADSSRMTYRILTVRTRDGRIWQPAFTSREQLEKAGAAKGMLLSWSIEELLGRFLPAEAEEITGSEVNAGKKGNADTENAPRNQRPKAPANIAGVVLNPGGKVLFLPRKMIESLKTGSRDKKLW